MNADISFMKDKLLGPNECFPDILQIPVNCAVVTFEDRLNKLYSSLFSKRDCLSSDVISVGRLRVTVNTCNQLDQIISLLSPIADYRFE
jgi:hypothetical protein